MSNQLVKMRIDLENAAHKRPRISVTDLSDRLPQFLGKGLSDVFAGCAPLLKARFEIEQTGGKSWRSSFPPVKKFDTGGEDSGNGFRSHAASPKGHCYQET
ncbi:MAG: hypothetical protein ACKVX9_10810 [Blastocatellia bacterium]